MRGRKDYSVWLQDSDRRIRTPSDDSVRYEKSKGRNRWWSRFIWTDLRTVYIGFSLTRNWYLHGHGCRPWICEKTGRILLAGSNRNGTHVYRRGDGCYRSGRPTGITDFPEAYRKAFIRRIQGCFRLLQKQRRVILLLRMRECYEADWSNVQDGTGRNLHRRKCKHAGSKEDYGRLQHHNRRKHSADDDNALRKSAG